MSDSSATSFISLPSYFEVILRHGRSVCAAVDPQFRLLWHSPHLQTLFPHFVSGYGRCYELFNREGPCAGCPLVVPDIACNVVDFEQSGRYGSKERNFRVTCLPSRDAQGKIVGMFDHVREITADRAAIAEHARLSEFHEKIITHAPVAIFTLDQYGIIRTTNPAHLRIAGDAPPEVVLGLDWLNTRSVKESGLYYYLRKGLAGEPFEVSDLSYTTSITGRHLYMTVRGVPLKARDNTIEGLLCMIEDTTEKTQYLRQLERIKAYDEHILESITTGIAVLDLENVLWTVNTAMAEMLGAPREELLESDVRRHLQRLGAEACAPAIAEVFRTGLPSNRAKLRLPKEGGQRTVVYRVLPLLDDRRQQYGAILIMEDVTAREKMEVMYRHLFENANDAIVVSDVDGRIISANRKLADLVGEDALKAGNFFHLLSEDDVFRVGAGLEALRSGREIEPFEVALRTAGKPVPIEISISLLLQRDTVMGVQFIVRDIRRRVELEEQLLQATKISALGGMAAGVAHEINNPLATIAACAEEVLDLMEEPPGDPASQLRSTIEPLVRLIHEQSYRCKRITNDLLDFARLKQPAVTRVDLNEVITRVVNLTGFVDETARSRIRLHLKGDLPAIRGDASQLEQVFVNLLNNAFDATTDGGGIAITTKKARKAVKVLFEDTGVGMSQEQLDKLFHPFFTTKAPNKGTGLGLSICYRIVERYNGRIEVSSEEQRGTTFTLTFPACEPP